MWPQKPDSGTRRLIWYTLTWKESNGAELLTEEIRRELAEYTEEELMHTVIGVTLRL